MTTRGWVTGPAVLSALMMLPLAAGCDGENSAPRESETVQPVMPRPVSGGTLYRYSDTLAVAADSDRDVVYFVDIAKRTVKEFALEPGDEPGRVIGSDGMIHVALRSGGAVASIDIDSGAIVRREACAAPRGLAYDDAKQQLHVACAGGELVTYGADLEAPPMRALRLEPDLRDVIVRGDQLVVSVFRAAKVLVLGADGALVHELTPHDFTTVGGGLSGTAPRAFTPTVAYRSVLLPDGNVAVVHQRSLAEILPTGPSPTGNSYYGGFCSDVVVHAAVTIFDTDSGAVVTNEHAGGVGTLVLPVDIAAAPDGSLAVVGAGSEAVFQTSLARAKASEFIDNCGPDDGQAQHEVIGEPVAVQYGLDGILVQTRQPASLQLIDPVDGAVPWRIDLPGPSRRHVGHALFSRAAGVSSPIACASCHPEGRDDGHVWHFEGIGARRTQSMLGGVLDTVPLHWDGDMTTLHELFDEVFINRMGGVEQDPSHVSQLGEWMQQLPAMIGSRSGDDAAAQRGDALFHDPEVACASCHSGEKLTNNQSVDVGTGRAFQVPSLVGILHRAPFMHDGCAATLHDRFTPECGGDAHGNTAQLSPAQLDDLVAYLETL